MRTRRQGKAALTIAAAILALTMTAGFLSGCPGTLDDPSRFTGCPDVPALLTQKCATPLCHVGANAASQLDFMLPGIEARVAGQQATTCVGGVLANPSDPEGSVLYRKLTDAPPCGAAMPLGAPALSDYEVDCVLEWIGTLEAGPPPSDGGADDAADASD